MGLRFIETAVLHEGADHRRRRQRSKRYSLASGNDRGEDVFQPGRRQHDVRLARRLFERLEEGVLRLDVHPVRVVDHEQLQVSFDGA